MIEKVKKSGKEVFELYLLFCFYSIPFCGIITIPGLFFPWWMQHVGYPCVVVVMITILSFAITVTILFWSKKSKKNPPTISVLKIGNLRFSSNVCFFNDTADIHNAEEQVILQSAEFNIFLFIDNNYQVGILQLSTSENYSPFDEILKNDILYPNRYVVVDSGTIYLISKSPMVYTSLKSESVEFDTNKLLEFSKVDDDYSCLKIRPIYGDGDYRIKIKDDPIESILIIEIIGGTFENYILYPNTQ
ncbi:MAG: hypothetical protein LBP59_15775 [Planctomycetaceae bacterium]|jgi:hypothetical protein|nr:hypothetical protein [Planctomycetaceae bacterium]